MPRMWLSVEVEPQGAHPVFHRRYCTSCHLNLLSQSPGGFCAQPHLCITDTQWPPWKLSCSGPYMASVSILTCGSLLWPAVVRAAWHQHPWQQ